MSETNTQSKKLGKVWWISAGAVFLIAVMAIIIFVNPAKPQTPAAAPTVTTEKPAGGCDVPAGDTSSKPAMPKDLRWKAEKGWTWPVSDTYGPTQTKNGYGVCFARSPLGAALAAVTLTSSSNTIGTKAAVETYAFDSPGKQASLAKSAAAPAGAAPVSFAGFVVDSFSPSEVQLTLVVASAQSPTGYVGIPETFGWADGDWKLKLLDDGSAFAGQPTNPVKGSFVSWGGANG